tara:strand:- start:281 stop:640 length:360 start_codon:yes stop_codon:yes gene_type:complete
VGYLATYDERLAGLLAIGMPRRVAMVVAFRPELVAELGQAANIAMNPSQFALEEVADRKGVEEPKKRRRRKSAYSKALSKALVEENANQRKKNGDFKKGKNAGTVLKAAHKKARRMMKK